MAQPILDPNTGQIIGFQDASTQGSPWESMSASDVAAINQPPETQLAPSDMGPMIMSSAPTKRERDIMAQMTKLQMDRISQQGQMVDQSQQRLNLLRDMPTQTDLSPLTSLADAWTGSHLSQGYQKPETPIQRQEKLMGYENQIANQRDKVTDNQTQLLQANLRDKLGMMRAGSQDAMMRARLAAMAGGKQVPANLAAEIGGADASVNALGDAQKLLEDNKDLVGPGQGRLSSALGYLQIGDQGKKAATLNAELKSRAQIIGKYLEGGKLTDADIERYVQQLPGIQDSPEVAQAKIANLQRLISSKQQAELAGLKAAGYKTDGISSSKAPALQRGGPPAGPAGGAPDYHSMSDAQLEALMKGQ